METNARPPWSCRRATSSLAARWERRGRSDTPNDSRSGSGSVLGGLRLDEVRRRPGRCHGDDLALPGEHPRLDDLRLAELQAPHLPRAVRLRDVEGECDVAAGNGAQ